MHNQQGQQQAKPKDACRISEEQDFCESVPIVLFSYKINAVTGVHSQPYMSSYSQEMLGVSAEAAMADSEIMVNLLHPEDIKKLTDGVLNSMSDMSTLDQLLRHRHPLTQKYITLRSRTKPYQSQEPNPLTGALEAVIIWKGSMIVVDDDALQEDNQDLEDMKASKLLMESPLVPFFSVNASNGCIRQWNQVMTETTGFEAADVLGKEASSLFYFPNLTGQPMSFQQIILSNSKLECTLNSNLGTMVYLVLSGQTTNVTKAYSTIFVQCKDITGMVQNPQSAQLRRTDRKTAAILNDTTTFLAQQQQQRGAFALNHKDDGLLLDLNNQINLFDDANPVFTGDDTTLSDLNPIPFQFPH